MRLLQAIAIAIILTGPAVAQSNPVPRYGEVDKAKSPAEIERDRAAEAAYKRSLGNVPNAAGPADPWGNIRNDGPAKTAVPARRQKSGSTAN